MRKKHVDRGPKLKEPFAECSLCGAHTAVTDDAMQLHILVRHPMELLSHPAVAPRAAGAAFELGKALAERFLK
jgi:hypothetical protein